MQGHGLRATFASIAQELVSSAPLKRMMNHAGAGDVTLGRYVAKSEAQLRAGWQAVADFVEGWREGTGAGCPGSSTAALPLPIALVEACRSRWPAR